MGGGPPGGLVTDEVRTRGSTLRTMLAHVTAVAIATGDMALLERPL